MDMRIAQWDARPGHGMANASATVHRTRRPREKKRKEKGEDLSRKEPGLERVKGIEPSYEAWEAAVLPLNYTRLL
jgi:hypothetical protein